MRRLVLLGAVLLAACDRSAAGARASAGDTAKINFGFADDTTPSDTGRHWIGIYQWDRRRPTFRPCDFALPLALRGSDSLLAFMAAKVDFQSPRPTTRLLVDVSGDTSSADSTVLPVFTVTALYDSRVPERRDCATSRGVAATPLDTTALDVALTRVGAGAAVAAHLGGSAYLNGDERADALVLYTAGATCGIAGCDLLVFAWDSSGYRFVSRTHNVKPPLLVREARSDGWREILVGTDVGGAFKGTGARLRYRAGRGYPQDATLEPPGLDDPDALVIVGGTLHDRPLLPGRLPRRWLDRPGL